MVTHGHLGAWDHWKQKPLSMIIFQIIKSTMQPKCMENRTGTWTPRCKLKKWKITVTHGHLGGWHHWKQKHLSIILFQSNKSTMQPKCMENYTGTWTPRCILKNEKLWWHMDTYGLVIITSKNPCQWWYSKLANQQCNLMTWKIALAHGHLDAI